MAMPGEEDLPAPEGTALSVATTVMGAAIAGRPVRKVVVVPGRMVNIVV